MARIISRGAEITITGIEDLVRRAEAERLYRGVLRKALRQSGKMLKREYVVRARAISRRLARRARVKVDRGTPPAYLPTFARVSNAYAGGPAIVSGRRVGAKQPPLAALKGGFAAARLVSQRGLPAHPFVPAAVAAARPEVERLLAGVGRAMEAAWAGS